MSIVIFSNNAKTTLAGAITNVALTANLSPGSGAEFTAPTAGQYFVGSFFDAATGLITEIVYVTGLSGDTITMTRGQEGTTAEAWNAGDIFGNFWTAGQAATMLQAQQGQAQQGNYASGGGSANAITCTLSPALTAVVVGMPIRVKIAATPTSPTVTFNPGPGALPVLNPDGTQPAVGTMTANGIYEFTADGSGHYQLISASNAFQGALGLPSTGDFKFRPTTETIAGWVIANATTIGNAASNGTQRANADTVNLFTWIWTNFSASVCPMFTSGGVPTARGGSAAADYAANRQLTLPDWRGIGPVGVDTMGGGATTLLSGVTVVTGSTTVPGSVLGENVHTLVSPGEIPAHLHSITDPGHSHTGATGGESVTHTHSSGTGSQFLTVGTTTAAFTVGGGQVSLQSNTSVESVGHTHSITSGTTGITTQNTGSSGGHNTLSRSQGVYWYIKL